MNQTFRNFIIGKTNELAYQLAGEFSNLSGKEAIPIYIYGESGSGKTHLLKAIENEIAYYIPARPLIYITGEAFVDEFIACIRDNMLNDFRKKYTNVDYLLIDGVEKVFGKESVQKELINIINILSLSATKVAVTACCKSSTGNDVATQLDGRFRSGCVAKINPPDFDLKKEIIIQELELQDLHLPISDIDHLADCLSSNLFVVKGAIKMLATIPSLSISDVIEDYR